MNTLSKLPGARCSECSLYDCPVVPPAGNPNAKLIVIGEAPGAVEVEKGEPFVGPSGKLLQYALEKVGLNYNDVWRTNAVMCRPPANREPTEQEILACMPRLEEELEEVTGNIIALGKTATNAMGLGEDRGVVISWGDRKVTHSYHPAYLLRTPGDSAILFRDIERLVNGPLEIPQEWVEPVVNHVTDIFQLDELLSMVPDDTWVAFDIETDNIRWFPKYDGTPADPILMLQAAWEDPTWGLMNFVIDDEMIYDTPGVADVLRKFFNRMRTCAHNGKFDQIFLWAHIGLKIHLDFDTMLAHAILDENATHGLKTLTYEYFGIPDYEERLIKQFLRNRNDRYSKIPFEPLAKYGVIDVIMTLQFRKVFQTALEEQGRMDWPFNNVIMRAANTFVDIEYRGIQIDVPSLYQVKTILEKEMHRIEELATQSVGRLALNLDSPQQVATVIYDQLGFPPCKNRKLGPRSTNHAAVEPLKGKHPFIDHLMEYRRVSKMKSSYAETIEEALDINGCVHTTFLVQGTEIGRLSARKPALQTIPRAESAKDKKGFWGAMIKSVFVARPGKVFVVCDYSQAELRVAAVLANEPFLIQVYLDDRDLHTEVAIAMYGPDFTKEQRMNTKMFNFSYLYGGNEYSFAMDAGLPITVAKKFVADYNDVMPNLAKYRTTQFQTLAEKGYVQSPFGRRRHFEIITKANMDDARKASVHAPIAGTASDLTLLAACKLQDEGYDVLLLVHDSVIVEVDQDIADEAAAHITEVMEGIGTQHLPQVRWKADPEVRQRWSDLPKEQMEALLN